MSTIRVTKSPWPQDGDLPWEYDEDGFIDWVWEVLCDLGKCGNPSSLDEAVEIAELCRYEIEVLP